jgi:hypothetical protein
MYPDDRELFKSMSQVIYKICCYVCTNQLQSRNSKTLLR